MKTWAIDYAIRMKDGSKKETSPVPRKSKREIERPTIKAEDIQTALTLAQKNIIDVLSKDPDIEKIVIFDIGIMEDDPF